MTHYHVMKETDLKLRTKRFALEIIPMAIAVASINTAKHSHKG